MILLADVCPRCGQLVALEAGAEVCSACRALERAPQGDAVRLFEPAPAPMPGQLLMSDADAQQAWADGMTDAQREAYEDGIARRRAERGVF